MATYLELYDLISSPTMSDLRKKIRVAIQIKANLVAEATTPTEPAKEWARSALRDPQQYEQAVMNYIIADNAGAATSAISGATDAQVQTAVNAAVDALLGA